MQRRDSSGEEPQGGLSRAQLVRRAGMLGAAAAIPVAATPVAEVQAAPAADTPPPEVGGTSPLRALTAAEAATLEAFLERLLPSGTAAGPGAKEANVLRYIDWSLAGDLAVFHPAYSAAIAAIEAFSVATYKAAFTAITPAQQDVLVGRMAAGAEKTPPLTQTTDPRAGVPRLRADVAVRLHDAAHARAAGHVRRPDARRQRRAGGLEARPLPGPAPDHQRQDQELDVMPKATYLKSTYTYKLFKNTTRRP